MAQAIIIDSPIVITKLLLLTAAFLLPLKRSAIMIKVLLLDSQSFDHYLTILEAAHHLSKLICHSHQLFAQLLDYLELLLVERDL